MAQIKNARKVKVQQRSGFDKSFRNTLTGNVGTLIPILVDELIPDTKVNLRINLATALPPLVSDTYMNVRLRVEAFVVPHRLCQANFEDFFSDYPVDVNGNSYDPTDSSQFNGCMPLIELNSLGYPDFAKDLTGAGSLTDYFGIETRPADNPSGTFGKDIKVPVAPYVAYHLIWQEWYRNPRVQRSAFVPSQDVPYVISSYSNVYAFSLPYSRFYFLGDNALQPTIGYDEDGFNRYILHDGSNILDLRQRNFGLDYFTSAMVEPQQGDVAVVKFGENGDPEDGFSIASLRAMNSIQQFRERNGLTSPRYQQQLYARYGVAPSDGVIQRPVLIGAATYDVYSHGVTSTGSTDAPAESSNPFAGSLGQRAGNAFAGGSDFIISGFHAKEPMYLIVLASLVPEVSYSQNLNMIFRRYKGFGSITDMGNAILQNVGPQPITNDIISVRGVPQSVFAYADRYSDFMYKNNEIHGEFKYGRTLSSFVLQRFFATTVPEFGSEFLTIPTDYLDDVLSVSAETLGFGYWMDIMFDYRVSMPLQEYAIPSLQDPGYEHGKTIVLRKNGQLL